MNIQLNDVKLNTDGYPTFVESSNYPSLQVTNYRPKLDEKVSFVLSDKAVESEQITPEAIDLLKLSPVTCSYETGVTEMLNIGVKTRWIILNKPKLFAIDKDTSVVYPLERGVKLKDSNRVTVSRLFLACIVENVLLLDSNKKPQIFTLKLRSTNVALIESKDTNKRTITGLNKALCKLYKTNGRWLTSAVSVELLPNVVKKTSSIDSKKSSIAVEFDLADNAVVIKEDFKDTIKDFVNSSEFMKLNDDPFNLAKNVTPGSDTGYPEYPDSPEYDENGDIVF